MAAKSDALPGVSYVMPVLNEVQHIEAAINSLTAQDYAGDFEIILALGPSVDGTNDIVSAMAAADPRIRRIDNELGSTPGGLNVAIRASVKPVVIRVDAHWVFPPDYTRVAVRTLLETGADNVGGIMKAVGVTPFRGCRPRLRLARGTGWHAAPRGRQGWPGRHCLSGSVSS